MNLIFLITIAIILHFVSILNIFGFFAQLFFLYPILKFVSEENRRTCIVLSITIALWLFLFNGLLFLLAGNSGQDIESFVCFICAAVLPILVIVFGFKKNKAIYFSAIITHLLASAIFYLAVFDIFTY